MDGGYFGSRYFLVTKKLMCITGLWPKQHFFKQISLRSLFGGFLLLACIGQIQTLQSGFADRNKYKILKSITAILTFFNIINKYGATIFFEKKRKRLFRKINRSWNMIKDEDELVVLKKSSEFGRFLALGYTAYMIMGFVSAAIIPLFPIILDSALHLNNSLTQVQVFLVDGDYFLFEKKDHYYLTHILESLMIGSLAIATAVGDAIYVSCVHHCVALISVFNFRVRTATKFENRIQSTPDHDVVYDKLVEAVKLHQIIIDYSRMLQRIYSVQFILVETAIFLILSLGMNVLIADLHNFIDLSRDVLLFIGGFLHMFYLCLQGQILFDASQKISSETYNNDWYKCSLHVQKLTLFIIMMAKKPIQLTAGRFNQMNLEFFGVFVKSGFSYVAVIASLGEENNLI